MPELNWTMDWTRTAVVLMQAADVVCSASQTAAGSAATAASAKEAEGSDSCTSS